MRASLIAEQFAVDAEEITAETNFEDDLGADSVVGAVVEGLAEELPVPKAVAQFFLQGFHVASLLSEKLEMTEKSPACGTPCAAEGRELIPVEGKSVLPIDSMEEKFYHAI